MIPQKKEEVKTRFFNLWGKFIVGNFQQGKIGLMLVKNINIISQSKKSMDAYKVEVAGCQSLIAPMAVYVKFLMNKVEENYCSVQKLQQAFLKVNYQSRLAALRPEAPVVTSLTGISSEPDVCEQCQLRRKLRAKHHNRRGHSTRFTWQEGDKHETWKCILRRAPAPEDLGRSLTGTKAAGAYKSRDASNESQSPRSARCLGR